MYHILDNYTSIDSTEINSENVWADSWRQFSSPKKIAKIRQKKTFVLINLFIIHKCVQNYFYSNDNDYNEKSFFIFSKNNFHPFLNVTNIADKFFNPGVQEMLTYWNYFSRLCIENAQLYKINFSWDIVKYPLHNTIEMHFKRQLPKEEYLYVS